MHENHYVSAKWLNQDVVNLNDGRSMKMLHKVSALNAQQQMSTGDSQGLEFL